MACTKCCSPDLSKLDRYSAFAGFKWTTFLVCLLACVYQIIDSGVTYSKKRTGSKLELEDAGNVPLPDIAICRNPEQILDFPFKKVAKNLTLDEMEFASETYNRLFRSRLFLPQTMVNRIMVTSRINYVNFRSPSLPYTPGSSCYLTDASDFKKVFHPIYGNCLAFPLGSSALGSVATGDLEDMFSSTDILKILISFEEVESSFVENDCRALSERDYDYAVDEHESEMTDEDVKNPTKNTSKYSPVKVFLYQNNSLLSPFAEITVNKQSGPEAESTIYIPEQELLNRSAASEAFQCSNDKTYDEDSCLMGCLMDKFREEFNCTHARLEPLLLSEKQNETVMCRYSHLLEQHKKGPFYSSDNVDSDDFDEIGHIYIEHILNSFVGAKPEELEEKRCGCLFPCVTRIMKLRQRNSQKMSNPLNYSRLTIEFPDVQLEKSFHYHYLYSQSDLIADVGGYLGLFLGLSIFSLVEWIEVMVLKRQKKEEKKLQKQLSIINDMELKKPLNELS